jgi:hypothetical protein
MAVYEYFRSQNAQFYYLPIGKNLIQVIDKNYLQKNIPVTVRLSLHEYLKANGLSYTIKEQFAFTKHQASELFESYKKSNFVFESFPVDRAQKMSKLNEKPENIRGTWFEEFVYYSINEQMQLDGSAIAESVMIYQDKKVPYNDNEFDVMFVLNNDLFVVECKVHLSGNQKAKLDVALQKLGAISKNFGLRTSSWIFTLTNLRYPGGNFNPRLLRKCEVLNVEPPVDMQFFKNEINFCEIFKIKKLWEEKFFYRYWDRRIMEVAIMLTRLLVINLVKQDLYKKQHLD